MWNKINGNRVDKYFYIITIIMLAKYLFFLRVSIFGNYNANVAIDSIKPRYIILYVGYIIILNSVSFVIKGRAKIRYLFIVDLINTILIISDTLYYRAFTDFLSVYLINQRSNFDGLTSSILILFRGKDILFVIDIIIIFFILKYYKKNNYKVDDSKSIFKFCLYMLSGVLIIILNYNTVDFKERYNSWNKDNRMLVLGPINYHIKDISDFCSNDKYSLSEKDKTEIKAWYQQKEPYFEDEWFGRFKYKNLIIIQVESLENFVVNKTVNNQEITPNINEILKQSLYFNNYRENTNNGNSSDSDLMTNAGVYPVREGSVFFRFPTNKYKQSLPNILGKVGYRTTAIKSCKGSFWNWVPALKSIGFQQCLDNNDFKNSEVVGFGLSDREYFNQVLDKSSLFSKQPFYNFLVTSSSHTPFKIPEVYQTLKLSDELKNTDLGDYFQAIHYTDGEIGRFIKVLNERGILEDSLVVIYGDHTGPEKYFYDKIRNIKNAESWWLNNDKRIPLIFYSKDIKPEVKEINSSQIDLLPTVLYLMGIDYKYYDIAIGKNLFTSKNDFCVLQDLSIIGNASEVQIEHAKKGIILSDKMVRSNYFKK